MNENLRQLIKVSELDMRIDALNPAIEQRYNSVQKLKDQREKAVEEISNCNLAIDDSLNQTAKSNEALLACEDSIKALDKRAKEIKSDKEIKVIDMDKDVEYEKLKQINNEIDLLEKEREALINKIKELETQVADLGIEIEEKESTAEVDIEKIKQQQNEIFNQKHEIVVKIDKKIMTFYEKIRKWAQNTSVVGVRKHACGGCFIKLSDKIYSEVLNSDEIINCPHCGRILHSRDVEIQKEASEAPKEVV